MSVSIYLWRDHSPNGKNQHYICRFSLFWHASLYSIHSSSSSGKSLLFSPLHSCYCMLSFIAVCLLLLWVSFICYSSDLLESQKSNLDVCILWHTLLAYLHTAFCVTFWYILMLSSLTINATSQICEETSKCNFGNTMYIYSILRSLDNYVPSCVHSTLLVVAEVMYFQSCSYYF